MTRIVVVASEPQSLVTFRGHLLSEMVKLGHEVYACAPGENDAVARDLAEMGVQYRAIYLNRTGVNPLADVVSLVKLTRLFRSLRPDVFLGYTIKPVIYGSLAARIAGVGRTYSMITGLGYSFSGSGMRSKVIGYLVRSMYRLVLKRNDRVIFQNPDDLRLLLDLGLIESEDKARIVNGSGVDVSTYAAQPLPQELSFLLIARLLRDKGIVEYVEAARAIRAEHPQVKCRLVGIFDENPAAISKSEVMDWVDTGAIEFLGSMSDVRPALGDCSVYVLPSYREGTPRTVLEAMSSGRPIITTDAPGCRETVDDGKNGTLVPVRDADALSAAMRWFIEHPDQIAVMGERSRRKVLEKYDVRKVTPTILDAMDLWPQELGATAPAPREPRPETAAPRDKLRIVVLGSIADSLIRFRGHLLQTLAQQGHHVVACAPGPAAGVEAKLRALGVEYREVQMQRTGLNPISDLGSLVNLWRTFREVQPDAFLGYTIKPVIYGSLAAHLAGASRTYSMITGLGYAFSESGLKSRVVGAVVRRMIRVVLSRNQRVFFQNPDDRQVFLDERLVKPSQCSLINGSGVDIDEFAPQPFPEPVSFLLIARLIRDKGIVEYVKAAAILRERWPDARFRLVGVYDDNPMAISRAEVEGWVSAGKIEFLGSMDDVRPALADSSVYVLPSFYREGTPRTVLEAMAMGRPIITTDAPGCRETVDDGENGFLVPTQDVDALVAAMERFLKDPALIPQMGAASRAVACEKYDVRKVTGDIIDGMNLDDGRAESQKRVMVS